MHFLSKEPAVRALATALATAAMLASGAAAAAASGVPHVTISPLPGTPDASPYTQISFLGAPEQDLRQIQVVGSRTHGHQGRLEAYSTGNGASYLPSKPFSEGETVTVTAVVSSGGSSQRISSRFGISHPYRIPRSQAAYHPSGPSSPSMIQSFHSAPDLHPPTVAVTTRDPEAPPGDLFISPDSGPGQAGAMIVEPSGDLVWFQPSPAGQEAMDLRVQQYFGSPVLTWWQGQVIDGHGQGEDVIETPSYKRIGTVHGGNGLYADLHEFELTPQGTALITAYAPIHWDLAPYGGPKEGLLNDCAVQEIDLRTGLVMFEWHALGHVSISDSYERASFKPGAIYDFFHINSIQSSSPDELLISARNTWGVYMIETATGDVQWTLGGKKSTFALGPGVRFAWQHDAELLSSSLVSIFDDEDSPKESTQSRAVSVALNFKDRQATLARQLTHPGTPILSPSQGNAQALPDGDELVGWGQAGFISEFAGSGALIFDMRLPGLSNSYRAYTFPWNAQPSAPPAIAASRKGQATTAYASWNGATDVARWQLMTGPSPQELQPVGTFARTGFETAMSAPTTQPYVAVQALGAEGALLGTSATIKPS